MRYSFFIISRDLINVLGRLIAPNQATAIRNVMVTLVGHQNGERTSKNNETCDYDEILAEPHIFLFSIPWYQFDDIRKNKIFLTSTFSNKSKYIKILRQVVSYCLHIIG